MLFCLEIRQLKRISQIVYWKWPYFVDVTAVTVSSSFLAFFSAKSCCSNWAFHFLSSVSFFSSAMTFSLSCCRAVTSLCKLQLNKTTHKAQHTCTLQNHVHINKLCCILKPNNNRSQIPTIVSDYNHKQNTFAEKRALVLQLVVIISQLRYLFLDVALAECRGV